MSRAKITSIGQAFLSRFPSPTIFLKIPCDGEFLLPIVVDIIIIIIINKSTILPYSYLLQLVIIVGWIYFLTNSN